MFGLHAGVWIYDMWICWLVYSYKTSCWSIHWWHFPYCIVFILVLENAKGCFRLQSGLARWPDLAGTVLAGLSGKHAWVFQYWFVTICVHVIIYFDPYTKHGPVQLYQNNFMILSTVMNPTDPPKKYVTFFFTCTCEIKFSCMLIFSGIMLSFYYYIFHCRATKKSTYFKKNVVTCTYKSLRGLRIEAV